MEHQAQNTDQTTRLALTEASTQRLTNYAHVPATTKLDEKTKKKVTLRKASYRIPIETATKLLLKTPSKLRGWATTQAAQPIKSPGATRPVRNLRPRIRKAPRPIVRRVARPPGIPLKRVPVRRPPKRVMPVRPSGKKPVSVKVRRPTSTPKKVAPKKAPAKKSAPKKVKK